MRALILVDCQLDFLMTGALPVAGAEELSPLLPRLLPAFDKVVAVRQWHPANHISFAANHPWRKPGQIMKIDGRPQPLHIMHAVQGSFGADLFPSIQKSGLHYTVNTGSEADLNHHSGFYDQDAYDLGLKDWLLKHQIQQVYLAGLDPEGVLLQTALDGPVLGFETYWIRDACFGAIVDSSVFESKSIQEIESQSLLNP